MFFILSKIFSFLFMPFSWVMLLLAMSLFWKKRAKKLRWSAVIVLLFFSNTFILKEVNRLWEIPITLDAELKEYPVAAVLGGFAYYDTTTDRISFRESGDRLFQGLKLLQNGTVKHLVISGGSGYVTQPELRESLFVGAYLEEIGIPKNKVWLESESKNTKENAAFTAAILQSKSLEKQPIILCTSGYHMRRSVACFEKQGLTVIPYSTDTKTDNREYWIQDLLFPSAFTLGYWNVLFHEWIGYISYWFM
ncbi:MAG: YdcF family protein, partial [Salibacteraceae bacterium]|nr:YdcF family protein [Salibacteraceae bacterium]MDP4964271.1 YdcF family protein [Salibacteraceae bacterium]